MAGAIAFCAVPSITKEASELITAVYRNIKLVVGDIKIA